MARSHVTVRSGEQVVCEECLVADRPLARMRGLLGRTDLPRGEGVLLRPAGSIHTFFMRFPIGGGPPGPPPGGRGKEKGGRGGWGGRARIRT